MSTEDALLLEKWIQTREADAFKSLCAKYARIPYAVCSRILQDATEAEDVTQECLEALAALRKPPRGELAAWLHKVATYRALNRRRGEGRRKDRERVFAETGKKHAPIGWDDIYTHVDEAIAALPVKLRTAVVAHFLEEKTHEAIALSEGVSRAAISQRIQRGIEKIRNTLRRRGIPVGVGALGAFLEAHLAEAAPIPTSIGIVTGKIALSGMIRPGVSGSGVLGGLTLTKVAATTLAILALALVATTYYANPGNEGETNTVRTIPTTVNGPAFPDNEYAPGARPIPQPTLVAPTIPAGSPDSSDRNGDNPTKPEVPAKLDDKQALEEIITVLTDVFAAAARLAADPTDGGSMAVNSDRVVPRNLDAEVQTISVGSPAWRRHMMAQDRDPDAPELAKARSAWPSREVAAENQLDQAEALKIARSHDIPEQQIPELATLVSQSEELPFDVYSDGAEAIAISELVGISGQTKQPDGFLVFQLRRRESGRWSIQDIDLEDSEEAATAAERLMERSPGARLLNK